MRFQIRWDCDMVYHQVQGSEPPAVRFQIRWDCDRQLKNFSLENFPAVRFQIRWDCDDYTIVNVIAPFPQ